MATQKVIKYDPFKRGDTPVFEFDFTPPSTGFDWTGITADFALTNVSNPTDNTGAGVVRTGQTLTVNADNSTTVTMQPTVTESKALSPATTYKVEIQLKDAGDTNVATAVTGTVLVEQDYVI